MREGEDWRAQSVPNSHSELAAAAQLPRPSAAMAGAFEHEVVEAAPSWQTPSCEKAHVLSQIKETASLMAIAFSASLSGIDSSTSPPCPAISSSGSVPNNA